MTRKKSSPRSSEDYIQVLNMKRNEELFRSRPFIHVVMQGCIETHCQNCCNKFTIAVECGKCGSLYCSDLCRDDDEDHDLVCDLLPDLYKYSDQTRFMVKLLRKLDIKKAWDTGEVSKYLPRSRKFRHLLSHADKLPDNDQALRYLYNLLRNIIPLETRSWQYFKEVYGRLTINSFEMTDIDDFAVGWGLYLAPSILNHSCVPNAEANFEGKEIVIRLTVNIENSELSDMFISYISLSAPTEVRKAKLFKYYHFECLCLRCQGLKLSWVAADRFNPKLSDLLSNNPSISIAINDYAKGRERDYFWSLRCPNCTGRPVKCSPSQQDAFCKFCHSKVDTKFVDEYKEVILAVKQMIDADKIPLDAPQECLELMTGIVYPYSTVYIKCLELAIDDYILQNNLRLAAEACHSLLKTCRRFARHSSACVKLIVRTARLHEELGEWDLATDFMKQAQVEAYLDSLLLQDVMRKTKEFNYRKQGIIKL